jgi:hypothetical protein
MLFFSEKSEGKREDQAQKNAGCDRKIKGETSPPEKDVTREFPEHRHFGENSGKNTHADQDHAEKDQGFCKIAHAISSRV